VESASVTVSNSPPVATVGLDSHSPATDATITATVTASDADGDPVSLTYVWRDGATIVKTTSATSSLTDTLDLGIPGNGDAGDTVSVTVTPSDASLAGLAAVDSAVVRSTAFGLDLGSGTAYVTFGDAAKLDLATFTIETWFKRTGAEHDGLGLFRVKDGAQSVALGLVVDHYAILLGQVQDRLVLRNQHLLRIDHLTHGQLPDVRGHGCGEQQSLPFLGHHGQDVIEVTGETHVQHAVRLVQYDHRDLRKIQVVPVQEVHRPAWRGHHDVRAFPKLLCLRPDAHPAIDGHAHVASVFG
jgi:hypothetical protein